MLEICMIKLNFIGVSALFLLESSLLIGIIKLPSYYVDLIMDYWLSIHIKDLLYPKLARTQSNQILQNYGQGTHKKRGAR